MRLVTHWNKCLHVKLFGQKHIVGHTAVCNATLMNKAVRKMVEQSDMPVAERDRTGGAAAPLTGVRAEMQGPGGGGVCHCQVGGQGSEQQPGARIGTAPKWDAQSRGCPGSEQQQDVWEEERFRFWTGPSKKTSMVCAASRACCCMWPMLKTSILAATAGCVDARGPCC